MIHYISAVEGLGIDSLLYALTAAAENSIGAEPALITRVRHRQALEEVAGALARAVRQDADDLLAEDLRLGVRAIGGLTGRIDVEDILDVIFRDFCVGK